MKVRRAKKTYHYYYYSAITIHRQNRRDSQSHGHVTLTVATTLKNTVET